MWVEYTIDTLQEIHHSCDIWKIIFGIIDTTAQKFGLVWIDIYWLICKKTNIFGAKQIFLSDLIIFTATKHEQLLLEEKVQCYIWEECNEACSSFSIIVFVCVLCQ